LASSEYYNLLHFFHSSAFSAQELCVRWAHLLLSKAPVLHLEGAPVYVVDGLVAGKAGKKMPGVKTLHQASSGFSAGVALSLSINLRSWS
jgi:hypothetical protein